MINLTEFSQQLLQLYSENGNKDIALQQEAYMKNKFVFFGLKAPKRREIHKPFLAKKFLPEKENAINIAKELYAEPQRELHYFVVELMEKYAKSYELEDIIWIEFFITENSWWDTVDFVAGTIAGKYFKKFPNQIQEVTKSWMNSENMWLQRSALLFQLKYKEETDVDLLSNYILKLAHKEEFFIRKAIGWILREYGKSNPDWVLSFVEEHSGKLSNLSKREALKRLQK